MSGFFGDESSIGVLVSGVSEDSFAVELDSEDSVGGVVSVDGLEDDESARSLIGG